MILTREDAQDILDEDVSILGRIDFGIQFGNRISAIGSLIDEFDKNIVLLDDFNEQHFRKHVNQFRKSGSDYAVAEVLRRMDSMPWAADIFGLYLRTFVARPQVLADIVSFLNSPYGRLFPWTRGHYIRCLEGSAPSLDPTAETLLLTVAHDDQEHWWARANAVGVLARRGSEASCLSVQDVWASHLPLPVQKALCMCAERLPAAKRNRLQARRRRLSEDVSRTVDWLESRR